MNTFSSAAVEAKDLVKRFGGLTAVDRIGFEARAGECFGFLGKNGAGKSTVTEGRVRLDIRLPFILFRFIPTVSSEYQISLPTYCGKSSAYCVFTIFRYFQPLLRMKMMTGLEQPSTGAGFVQDHNVMKNLEGVRNTLGYRRGAWFHNCGF